MSEAASSSDETTANQAARASWQKILVFYADFNWNIDGWEHIKPFREQLVAHIAASPYGSSLFASQSHQALIISPGATWPERTERPCLGIWPDRTTITANFYSKNITSGPTESRTTTLADAWEVIEPWLAQLAALASPHPAETNSDGNSTGIVAPA